MTNSTASHGWWCSARTYPTRCKYCHADVFFFSCNCGSKVFFDELGGLWPEHNCRERWIAEFGKDLYGKMMAQQMMRPGIQRKIQVDAGYRDRVTKSFHRPRRPEIKRKPAEEDSIVHEVGFLREVIRKVDIYKVLGFERTPMASVVLGELVKETQHQITLHSGDLSTADVASYTCFIAETALAHSRCKKGELVSFELKALKILGRPPVWIVTHIAHGTGG
jgi:hypothetical protein